jgi:tetratricopeptide (TPR) repeat protein
MKKLIYEIHRRSLWQVLGLYAAGSWIVLQVVDQLVQSAGLPDWVPSLALVLLLIGFPMVLATAFVQVGMRKRDEMDDVLQASRTHAESSAAEPVSPAPGSASSAPTRAEASSWLKRNVFTWRNAIAGGVAALALFGAATAVWMVLRGAGVGSAGTLVAKGLIEDGDRVILADFSGDSALAAVATMAVRVDLGQSDVVSVAEPAYVAAVLDRMEVELGADAPLSADLAREAAIREGLKAVISGDVATVAGSHVISVRVTAAESGDDMVTLRETASDSTKVMDSIDRLSRQLRERLGESLGSIRNSASLAKATTSSLEALRHYSAALAAIDAGDNEKGIALLDEAIALDSTFGMAWRKLAAADPNRREMAVTRAYGLREGMTDRERYHAIGLYHNYVTQDLEAGVTAYSTLLDLYPEDAWALNNLGVIYGRRGEPDLAIEMFSRAIESDRYSSPLSYTNLIRNLHLTGAIDSAYGALEGLRETMPDHPFYHQFHAALAMSEGDYEAAEARLEPLLQGEMLGQRRWATNQLSAIERTRGRIARAERLRRESWDDPDSLGVAFWWAEVDVDLRHDTVSAMSRFDRAITQVPDSVVADAGIGLGFYYVLTGRIDQGRELFQRGLDADSTGLANVQPWQRDMLDLEWAAAQAYASGDYAQALQLMRTSIDLEVEKVPDRDPATDADDLADVLYVAGDPQGAIAEYERWLGRRELFRAWSDRKLAPILERVAQLYDELGDTENAAVYYAQFVDVWAEADPEFQPRVEAARARLEEIVRERG